MTDDKHPAIGRRDKIAEVKRDHTHISVPNGTEQAGAMLDVRNEITHLATMIVSRCPDSRATSVALTKLQEVQFWAMHSLSHRE